MIRLITDTSCLYAPEDALKLGFIANPLTVTIAGKSYREFVEIQPDEFIKLIKEGNFPTSSQPSIGSVIESIEQYPNDEIILLCMADGLSGTYQSALTALDHFNDEDKKRIHIINSKTLCGPHRYLVEITLQMIKENKTLPEILDAINNKIETISSFLMPQDFDYLKRGGRCTPIAATIGGLLKLKPVVMQTPDGRRLDKFVTARSFDIAINNIIAHYKKEGLDKYRLYISHAFAAEQALKIKEKFTKIFPGLPVDILELSCAFITQGGPYCIAIQVIEQ